LYEEAVNPESAKDFVRYPCDSDAESAIRFIAQEPAE
jgi:hypothetical protein